MDKNESYIYIEDLTKNSLTKFLAMTLKSVSDLELRHQCVTVQTKEQYDLLISWLFLWHDTCDFRSLQNNAFNKWSNCSAQSIHFDLSLGLCDLHWDYIKDCLPKANDTQAIPIEI